MSGCVKVRYPSRNEAWAALDRIDASSVRLGGKKEAVAYRSVCYDCQQSTSGHCWRHTNAQFINHRPAPTPDPYPGRAFPKVQGKCPACGSESLMLGSGGYVTCASLACPDPTAATDLLTKGKG